MKRLPFCCVWGQIMHQSWQRKVTRGAPR